MNRSVAGRNGRTAAVLAAIRNYTDDWGEPPTHEEVAELVDLHVGSVPHHVRKLRKEGLLAPGSGPGNHRCLSLTAAGVSAAEEATNG